MSRSINIPGDIILDGTAMDWDGAGNRYYAIQSVLADQGNKKCTIVYAEYGGDYSTDFANHEIMRIPEIVSHPTIQIRPDGQSAFVLGATSEGKLHLSNDIPGWSGHENG